MAVAAPARRSTAAPAPAPARTTPPKRAPARPRVVAPARAPVRKPAPKRPAGRPKLAVVAGRTAVAVGQLPDSGLVVRMTRGRSWIAVLGVLLVGIVALNVATLSFAATSGKIDEQITVLEKEKSVLESRYAKHYGTGRIRAAAAEVGMVMPTTEEPMLIEAHRGDAARAAERLAAAGG
jgi:hypothetical protein